MTSGTAWRPKGRLARTSLLFLFIASALIVVASAIPVTVTRTSDAAYGGYFIGAYYENQNPPVTGCTSPCLTVDTQTVQPAGTALSPALDGSAFAVSATGTTTSLPAALTTAGSADVVVVLTTTQVSTGYVTVSTVSATGLTFAKRASTTAAVGGYDMDFEEWYAVASSALSGLTITVGYSGTVTHYAVLDVFGVSRANTNSPFDPYAGLPSMAKQAAASVTTSYANDLVFGFELTAATASPARGAGWSAVNTPANGYFGSEYQQVAAPQSALAVTWSNAATDADVMLGDAIQGSNSFTLQSGSSAYLWSPQFAAATAISAGTWDLDIWAAGVHPSYVPMTLTNGQGTATPNPLQVLLSWNPSLYSGLESGTLGNVRFCSDSACNGMLYAWLEGCAPSCSSAATSASAWVKLTSSIAANGGTMTVYMVFEGTGTPFDGNHWGEAPQLSSTYGQYDNGASVFALYINGNSPPTNFNIGSNAAVTQKTGVSIDGGGASGNVLAVTGYDANRYDAIYNTALANSPYVGESNFELQGDHLNADQGPFGLISAATSTGSSSAVAVVQGWSSSYFSQSYSSSGTQINDINQAGTSASAWGYASLTYVPTSASWTAYIAPQLYSTAGGYSGTVTANPLASATSLRFMFFGSLSASYSADTYLNWVRVRSYPPAGVAPSVSLGAVSNVLSVSAYVTGPTGSVTSTVATGVLSPSLGTSVAEYSMTFAGALVTVPANGYISVVITAQSGACAIYWGGGQPTDIQVAYTKRAA